MTLDNLIKQLSEMKLPYGNKIILTVTDGESEYKIKQITGKQFAKYFEPTDKVSEVVITIGKRQEE